jgi:hypothetical protein
MCNSAPDGINGRDSHLSVTPMFGTPNVTLLYQIQRESEVVQRS